MVIHGIQLDNEDTNRLNSIIHSYQEVNEVLVKLQEELIEISNKKQKAEEKLELLKRVEFDFITFIEKKYNHKFDTNDLLKIILSTNNESSNMCNC